MFEDYYDDKLKDLPLI